MDREANIVDAVFAQDVLDIVCSFDAYRLTGTRRQPGISVSALISELRRQGWKKLGTNGQVEEAIKDLGFTVVIQNSRFFVTI